MGKKILNQFFMIGIGTVINIFIGLITTPIVTRIVGENVYGQFSIFTMYVGMGEMILCMGLDQGIIRFYHEKDSVQYRRKLIRACCLMPLIASNVIMIIVVLLSYFGIVEFEFDTLIIFLLGICVIVQIGNRLNMVQLRSAFKTKEYTIVRITHKLVYILFVLFFICALKFNHFKSMIVATIISYIVVLIYGIYIQRSEWKFWDVGPEEFNYKSLYAYSAPYIISMGVTTIFQAIDKISLNYYCTYSEVGIYASANNIINIFSIIQSTFNALWIPMSIEHYLKNKSDRAFYEKGNSIITVIMFVFGATLIVGKNLFVLLLGETYRGAAYIIPFLTFYPIMYTISETTVIGIVFSKKSNLHIIIAIISCLSNILGNLILVPRYGGQGAAISTGLSYIIFFLVRTIISNHYYHVNWRLKKFLSLTIIFLVYAFFNTFYDNILLNIVGYCCIIIFICFSYRESIKEGICLGVKQIHEWIEKRKIY